MFPPSTIKSAIETDLFFVSKFFLIFSNPFITISTLEVLFISQSFCGDNLILAPFAPPLLSDPLNVEADAHAVDTNWDIERPDFNILSFKYLTSLFFKLYFCLGIGSCQIKFSFGTSGPR